MKGKNLNIGVDVGGTSIKFGVTDEGGQVLWKDRVRTPTEGGSEGIIQCIVENIGLVLTHRDASVSEVNSLGLGIPGTTDSKNGIVVFAPNIFWKNVEIVKAVRSVYDVPVYIAQDTRAAAWAEYLVGAGKGLATIASVTLGTGIGCGIVTDGQIYHGALNTAGEFGHQIVEVDGYPCNCGRHGCLEAHAGGRAIVREAKSRISNLSALVGKPTDSILVHDVFGLAQQGNPQARRITEEVVRYVGIGLVNLINLTSPQLVSISGGISNAPDELLLTPLVEFVRNRAYQSISNIVRLCRSSLGDDAPMIGAALLYQGSGTGLLSGLSPLVSETDRAAG